ncbi:MAG: hypothetical protein ACOCSN_02385 [Halanaeroarchaeum sp.]
MTPPSGSRLADVGSPYRALLDDLLATAGDDTRFAIRYENESASLAYLREDLLADDLLPRIDEITECARRTADRPDDHARTAYGDLETTVDVYEDVLVLDFRGPDREGIVVAVDRSPGAVGRLLGA